MHQPYVQPLRQGIQLGFLVFVIFLGIRFFQFVNFFRLGGSVSFVTRPAGIEAFLPIAGLMGVKDWIVNGSINSVHPAAAIIFISVLAVSLLLKRSFCSWICPVGTVSELLWKLGFRTARSNYSLPVWLDLMLRTIKYLFLLFFLLTIFVRMPAEAVSQFIASDYHKVADVRLLDFFINISGFPLIVVTLLILISIPVKNAFCRYLCPYGALLGLISMLSPFKVSRNADKCITCGVCSQYCPSHLPVMTCKKIHSPECIGCWRCISNCRAEGALEMKLAGTDLAIAGIIFALLVVGIFCGGSLIGKSTGHWSSSVAPADYSRLLAK